MRTVWRLTAWITSAAVFAAHILYEHIRLDNTPLTTGLYVSIAAALGAFGLAVAANINAQFVVSANQKSLILSLLLWPTLIVVPAFIIGLALVVLLKRFLKKV